MPILNKPELVSEISEKTGETKATVERVLNTMQESIISHVAEGREVKISGFAAFGKSRRSARTVKNPRTGEDIQIAETNVAKIRPLKKFKDAISAITNK